MTNLRTLHRNMLETMSDDAGSLYMRAVDRDEWRACQMAWEWDSIADVLSRIQGVSGEVLEFMRERQFRRWFPGHGATA